MMVAIGLACGCSFHVSGIPVEPQSPDALSVTDLAGPLSDDLAGSTDMTGTITGCSSTTTRVCSDATHAAHCIYDSVNQQWLPTADRTCPPGSGCTAGHCQPPANAVACATSGNCSGGMVCDLFVVSGQLWGYCTLPFSGAGDIYTSCGPPYGNDLTCKTGVCALDATDSSHHQCLFPCSNAADCPGGNVCVPIGAPTTLEGVTTSGLKFCSQ